MREQFKLVTENMKTFGCTLIGKALYEATFMESFENAHSAAVVTAAHGAEIILKSCIAAEHPLLIFEKIPRINFTGDWVVEIMEKGKSVSYRELPDLLRLTTGYDIKNRTQYIEFGKLRNKIIHLGMHGSSYDTIEFAVEIIEPLINTFWQATIYDEIGGNHDSEAIYYFVEYCVEAHKSGHLKYSLSEIAASRFDEDSKKYLKDNFEVTLDDYID